MHAGRHRAACTVQHELSGRATLARADESRDATRPIAASLDLVAVGVEDPVEHRRARAARRIQHQGLVEADAGMAVGEAADRARIRRASGRGIEYDEVVAQPMHLGEAHSGILKGTVPYFWQITSALPAYSAWTSRSRCASTAPWLM